MRFWSPKLWDYVFIYYKIVPAAKKKKLTILTKKNTPEEVEKLPETNVQEPNFLFCLYLSHMLYKMSRLRQYSIEPAVISTQTSVVFQLQTKENQLKLQRKPKNLKSRRSFTFKNPGTTMQCTYMLKFGVEARA